MVQICSKCKRALSTECFTKGSSPKVFKTCNLCRGKRVEAYTPSESGPDPNDRKIELVEIVDKCKLNYLMVHHDKFNIGKSFVNGQLVDGKAQMSLLADYHNSLTQSGEVRIKYSQRGGFGRLYGHQNLQIQNLARPIRHTICQALLVDIDMKNAHPSLLYWYCGKNSIEREGLGFYIENREKCLKELVEIAGEPRDIVKADLLAVINGRVKTSGQVQGYPQWYINYYNNLQDIKARISVIEPEFFKKATASKKARNKEGFNIDGTCINYVMMDLENKALMCAYDVCLSRGIRVASLIYDGLMVYKNDIPPGGISLILQDMSDLVFKRLQGCRIEFLEKTMDEGFELDDIVEEYDLKGVDHLIDQGVDVLFRRDESDYITMRDVAETVEFVQDLDWEHNKVLCINAPMGRGKTTAVCRWIETNQPKRVIVLSSRVSYANSITHEYNEKIISGERFKCYKDLTSSEIEKCHRIVISMESLHKVDYLSLKQNPFDLVVVDECQANLTSHTCIETNSRNFGQNADVFYKILRTTQRLLFCDAFVNAKTCSFLTQFELPTLLLNYKVKMEPRKAVVVESGRNDYDALLPLIEEDLRIGKRLYVCMTSSSRLEVWAEKLRLLFPNKEILSYSKGKGKQIVNVRSEWGSADCVLTTSTITVGINFDVPNHFHKCYISFSSRAKNRVVDIIQTHYRVRHLIESEIVLHMIDSPMTSLCIDEYRLTKDLEWFEQNMIAAFELFQAAPTYLKKLLCYNQLEQNLSEMRMTPVVYGFLDACNYTVEKKDAYPLEEDGLKEETPVNTEMPFIDIKDILKSEYIALDKKRSRGTPLSGEESDQLAKYSFINFFTNGNPVDWVGNSFDNDFWVLFNSYSRQKMRNIRTEKQIKVGYVKMNDLFRNQYSKNSYAVMNNKDALRTKEMMDICARLGIDFTQKVGETISAEKLEGWCTSVRMNHQEIRNVFELRDRRQDKADMGKKNCIELLNSIFKVYGFTQIKQVRKRIRVDGKQTLDPNAHYVVEEADMKDKRLSDGGTPIGMRMYGAVDFERRGRGLLEYDPIVTECEAKGPPI
jgi:hypothetical protein